MGQESRGEFQLGHQGIFPGLSVNFLTHMAVKITIRAFRGTKGPMDING
jgi:hypothetical protein